MNAPSRFPSRDEAVLRYVLDRRADEDPDKVFAVFDDGPVWTRNDVRMLVRRTAGSLEALGVQQGDHVVCWLPNGPEAVLYFFAVNYLGAVYVPINTAYRGGVLAHVLANADASLIVADATLLPRLAELDSLARLETIVAIGDVTAVPDLPGLSIRPAAELAATAVEPGELLRPIEPWDTHAIIYTSGTTGPSKGVLTSYMQSYSMFSPETMPFMTAADRFLINMPFFHVGGMTLTYSMLLNGGSVAVVERFSGQRFWTQIKDLQATMIFLLGVMAAFISKRPPEPSDAQNPLAKIFMVPLVEDVPAFSDRFGVDIYTIYNMTELSAPVLSEVNPTHRGTCGRIRPGYQVRLVDHADREVAVGEVGEIVVRSEQPWALNHGYYKMPDATAAAWRNGWFHTGDSARRDASGNFFFADRLKDAIRRRGENISSMEVEAEILAHPDVREAAVVAVPNDVSEDDVLAIVAPVPGKELDPAELIAFLEPRMAYFMVPRYIRIVDELPKTDTAKIQKAVLRTDGVTPQTWDRETNHVRIVR